LIPILYEANTRVFSNNGIGHLTGAISCIVTEERNGGFELQMRYPQTGAFYKELRISRIIYAVPADGKNEQGFRIYKITKPINGVVTVFAEHISYQLSSIPCSRFSAASAAAALLGLKSNAATNCPFDFWTDVTTSGTFMVETPTSIRSRLGGSKGSILDVYGGEWEWDNYEIKLRKQRGRDNGVVLRYGKNIKDLNQEENITNTITGIYPFWKSWENEGGYIELDQKVVLADNAGNYPYPRISVVDCTNEFEEEPSQAQLLSWAQNYVKKTGIGVPAVSVSVSFVALWQTEEYKSIAPLERVGLCDTVTVEYQDLGVSAKAKVIKTTYNVLLDRYDSIEIGDAKSSLVSTIMGQQQEIQEKPSAGFMQAAVENATKWITGANGGYVVMHKNGNGQPYEILIMDTDNINTARKVWRWNQGGLGYSSSGYSGPYATAITQDGKIVADFITTGKMLANIIQGGILTLGGKNNGNGILKILDDAGKEIGLWDKSGIKANKGTFTGDLSAAGGTFKGDLSAAGGTFRGDLSAAGGTFAGSLSAAGGTFRGDLSAAGGTFAGSLSAVGGLFKGSINVGNLFSVDANGNVIANSLKSSNAQITGGSFQVVSDSDSTISLQSNNGYFNLLMGAELMSYRTSDSHATISSSGIGINEGDLRAVIQSSPAGGSYVIAGSITAMQKLQSKGTKSRIVDTKNYSERMLYCYEMPSPMFGDIGTGKTDESGLSYIHFDPIFRETITSDMTYYALIQKEGEGDLWIEEKTSEYFLVKGTPGLKFAWEVKARQIGYEYERIESFDESNIGRDIDYGIGANMYLDNCEREALSYEYDCIEIYSEEDTGRDIDYGAEANIYLTNCEKEILDYEKIN